MSKISYYEGQLEIAVSNEVDDTISQLMEKVKVVLHADSSREEVVAKLIEEIEYGQRRRREDQLEKNKRTNKWPMRTISLALKIFL